MADIDSTIWQDYFNNLRKRDEPREETDDKRACDAPGRDSLPQCEAEREEKLPNIKRPSPGIR